jgi:exopolysaccharide biosynthesis polyprenyl glycosylphosphotransferase
MSTVARPTVASKQHLRRPVVSDQVNWYTSAKNEVPAWAVARRLFVDILLVGVSGAITYHLRFLGFQSSSGLSFPSHPLTTQLGTQGIYLGFLVVYAAVVVLAAYAQRLYSFDPGRPPLMEFLLLVRAVAVATIILMAFIYLSGIKTVPRVVVGSTAACSLVMLSVWRQCRWCIVRQRFLKGMDLRHVLIIGAGKVGTMLADYLQQHPGLGYGVRGFLDSNRDDDPRIVGTTDDLPRVARQLFIDEVFITVPSERALVKQLALGAMELNLGVNVLPEFYDGLAWACPLDFVGDVPVRVLHRGPIPEFGLFLKRLTDIVGSGLLLVILSPLLAFITLAIAVDSRGPILYRAHRVGKKGHTFLCYKFRTMVPDADRKKDDLRHLNERNGPFFKISNDPRLTRIGGFLRRYSLDELPQLWNVLKGEMSLVGPRPHPLDDVKNYTLEHFRRLEVTPGITGLWQIEARHDPSFERAMDLDSRYIDQWSYLLDLGILLRTIPAVFTCPGK